MEKGSNVFKPLFRKRLINWCIDKSNPGTLSRGLICHNIHWLVLRQWSGSFCDQGIKSLISDGSELMSEPGILPKI